MAKQGRILIVDDSPINLAILQEILNDAYHVATAASGEAALALAPDFLPDVILLDIMMPGLDGYATCRQLRELPLLYHTKIMMVSAMARVEERLQGYEAGADDYITKPFDEEELLAKIRVYIRLKAIEEVDQLNGKMFVLFNHDTRTPLHSILLPVRELRTNNGLAPEEQAMFLEMIEHSAMRLQRLLQKVQTLSAMKAGQWLFEFDQVDLEKLVRTAVAEVGTRVSTVAITIAPNPPATCLARLDQTQIKWVINAMLENAIQFSHLDGQVTISVHRDDTSVSIAVSDVGDGIDAALLPHVFEPFGHPDGMHHTKGYGLSLALARQIALAHHGTIEVESHKGVGSTFTLRLPYDARFPALEGSANDHHTAD